MIADEMLKLCCRFSDNKGYRITIGIVNIRSLSRWRQLEIACKGEEMLQSKGEGVFEIGKRVLHEMRSWVWEFIEEKALHMTTRNPEGVKESNRKSGCGN